MARTLNALANRLDKAADNLAEQANAIKKKAATVIAKSLISTTPVDTSRALSNWLATIGAQANYSILAHSPGSGGSTRGASMSAALADAMNTIAGAKPGQPIFLTNNLRYIRALNDGHSKQAPAGFVERAELLGGKTVREAKIKV
jgi:hypothetical protein